MPEFYPCLCLGSCVTLIKSLSLHGNWPFSQAPCKSCWLSARTHHFSPVRAGPWKAEGQAVLLEAALSPSTRQHQKLQPKELLAEVASCTPRADQTQLPDVFCCWPTQGFLIQIRGQHLNQGDCIQLFVCLFLLKNQQIWQN